MVGIGGKGRIDDLGARILDLKDFQPAQNTNKPETFKTALSNVNQYKPLHTKHSRKSVFENDQELTPSEEIDLNKMFRDTNALEQCGASPELINFHFALLKLGKCNF